MPRRTVTHCTYGGQLPLFVNHTEMLSCFDAGGLRTLKLPKKLVNVHFGGAYRVEPMRIYRITVCGRSQSCVRAAHGGQDKCCLDVIQFSPCILACQSRGIFLQSVFQRFVLILRRLAVRIQTKLPQQIIHETADFGQ